jgi:tetratricopeptide (TPR) repeat protein/tRNA A-37 threonylcarbamoyl transferase component Bud32
MDPFRSRLEQALSGQYRFVRELGGGGMSRTYLADEPALQRRVVVKVLAPEMLEGLSVERFKREVLLAASLQHPHVVPVLAAGDADGLPWFSMPYVDGDSLRQRLALGPLPIGEAVAVLRDVARALSYAHGHGIVHRDIKPDNVLLSAGSATVTDFGIAKAITASRQAAGGATLTQVGLAIGTPAYMAPEQAEGATDIDHRADLYAFGAMAFELLTGQPVFSAATPGRLLVSHMTEAPRDPRVLRADIPAPLAALVGRCLNKLPGDRPSDANEIVRALDGVGSSNASAPLTGPGTAASLPLAPVLGSWAGGVVLLVGAVFAASRTIGVPSWAMPSAITLAVAGLPALLGAWWVQRTAQRVVSHTPTLTPGGSVAAPGTLATFALRAQPHVTVRRTRRLGVIAASALAVAVIGFVATRAYGIGPAASLIGAGEFGERESVLVADFRPPANDSTLGATVAEALRTDLAQSPNLAVVTRATVRELLQRMQRPADALVPFDVAREIATREGTKAVIDGDVVRLGSSYVLSARLVSATDGRELAAFRETAENDATLVAAVGQLSRSIREKVGESLKGLQGARALERVSTPSLAALRKYVEGAQLEETGGDRTRVLQLLNESVAIDSTFAMAWRKIAVMHSLLPNARTELMAAISKAYALRDRLSDNERDLTDAFYFTNGPAPDLAKAAVAYEQLLARDSLNSTALNNLAVLYNRQRERTKALELWERAARLDRPPAVAFVNIAQMAALLRRQQLADSNLAQFVTRFPNSRAIWELQVFRLIAGNRWDSVGAVTARWTDTAQAPRQLNMSIDMLVNYELGRGRITTALAASDRGARRLRDLTNSPTRLMTHVTRTALASALFDGDRAQTQVALRRLLTSPEFTAVPAPERTWTNASVAAALAGDAADASKIAAAYRRDVSPYSDVRQWEDLRVNAHVAMASGRFQEAVQLLKRAAPLLTAPGMEERFLLATSFDRLGVRDSAIAWFKTVVDPQAISEPVARQYVPAAHKRLAELLDDKGDIVGAIEHYDAFATLWKDAEPSRQPIVTAARDRAAQLRAKKDPG